MHIEGNIKGCHMVAGEHKNTRPCLGFRLGLRKEHNTTVLESRPKVHWFEIISENYMVNRGKPLDYLTIYASATPWQCTVFACRLAVLSR